MCARRAPRQPDPEPENQVPLVVQPSTPADSLPVGMNDNTPPDDQSGPDDFGDLFALSDESYRDVLWYVWRRRAPGEVQPRTNPNAPIYVAKIVGAIDLEELAKQIGGGSFRLCGYRNGHKFIERPIEIEGPRKSQVAAAPPPAVNGAAQGQDVAAAVAAGFERLFEKIEQKLQPPPPPPTAQPYPIKEMIEMAKMLRPEPAQQQSPDASIVNSMIGMLKQGIELGATRDPGAGGTDWGAVIEKATPLVEKFLTGMAARRGVPPRRPPGQPVPPSRAEVISDPAPAPPATDPEPPEESPRMAAVVDSLARAVEAMGTETEIEPADFAATIETVLIPSELAMLRLTTTDGLMAELASVSDRYPILAKPQARAFVDAVLSELRSPTE